MSTLEQSKNNAKSMYGKRQIGQVLVDANLITEEQLETALKMQQTDKQVVGAILSSMDAVSLQELNAALSVQDSLGSVQDIIGVAAGSREFLGELLVTVQRITPQQLETALREQVATERKLGDIFVRHGWLSENELIALLAFQSAQASSESKNSPLRIGNLLVTTGILSEAELEDALQQQQLSKKKIGDVLVESGYVKPREAEQGLQLQRNLLGAVLSALLCFSAILESRPVVADEASSLALVSTSDSYTEPMESSAEELYQLALMYLKGKGMQKNVLKAIELFKAAAEKEHAEAQYTLGLIELDYDNAEVALFWLGKAVKQGHKGAQFTYNQVVEFDYDIGC